MSDDKKKPNKMSNGLSYFLDHPNIKRNKSLGNFPNEKVQSKEKDHSSAIKKQDTYTKKSITDMRDIGDSKYKEGKERFQRINSSESNPGKKLLKTGDSYHKRADSLEKIGKPKKVAKPVSKVKGLGEKQLKDKVK